MGGGGGVGFGNPDVHGRQARLGPETQQPQQEERLGEFRMLLGGKHAEIRAAAHLPEQGKIGNEQHGAQMRRHQIDPRGIAHLALAMVEINEKEGSQRHHFPRNEEEYGVACRQHQGHAQNQQHIEQPVRRQIVRLVRHVAQQQSPVQGTDGPQPEDRQKKESRQRVQPQGQFAHGQPPRTHQAHHLIPRSAEYACQPQPAGHHHHARPHRIDQCRQAPRRSQAGQQRQQYGDPAQQTERHYK